jgi:hypothetical protein
MRNAIEVAHCFGNRQPVGMHRQRFVELAAGLQNVGNFAHRHGALAHVAEPLIDRQLLLVADFQRLVELAAGLQNVGDFAHGHGALAHVAEPLIDRQLLLGVDPQRLVELPAGLQDVGDFAFFHRH